MKNSLKLLPAGLIPFALGYAFNYLILRFPLFVRFIFPLSLLCTVLWGRLSYTLSAPPEKPLSPDPFNVFPGTFRADPSSFPGSCFKKVLDERHRLLEPAIFPPVFEYLVLPSKPASFGFMGDCFPFCSLCRFMACHVFIMPYRHSFKKRPYRPFKVQINKKGRRLLPPSFSLRRNSYSMAILWGFPSIWGASLGILRLRTPFSNLPFTCSGFTLPT